jgi:hypothetical protein
MKSLGIDPQRDLNLLLGNVPIDSDDSMEDEDIISIPMPEELKSAIEALKVRTRLALQSQDANAQTTSEYLSLIEEFRNIFLTK